MKKFEQWLAFLLLLGFISSTTGCILFEVKKVPPGHTKKIEATQKPKNNTPGHTDKKGKK